MYICMCLYMHVQMSTEVRGIGCPGAQDNKHAVVSHLMYESPDVAAGV